MNQTQPQHRRIDWLKTFGNLALAARHSGEQLVGIEEQIVAVLALRGAQVRDVVGYGCGDGRTLRFRGREMAHNQLGMAVLERVREDTAEIAKVEQFPRMEGRQMLMVVAPK